jgi:hypothetical protein
MKIGVCIRAKNEQKIINDWVAYYLQLGFDKIIIYDNMSSPSIQESLEEKGNYNPMLIDIRIDTNPFSNQGACYNECIQQNKDLDWLLICDADEFIWHKDHNIKAFLATFPEDTCTILINWLVYGTSHLQKYNTTKTVFEQFIYREPYSHFWNQFVKSFIRPKLVNECTNVHYSYHPNYTIRSVYGTNISLPNDYTICHWLDLQLSNNTPVVIVHYMTLDYESMNEKHQRNLTGQLIENYSTKYTLAWYRSNQYRFNDEIRDTRMINNA